MEIRSGDEKSFRYAYDELFPVLMKVAYHITFNADVAEDICQDAFIKFYDKDIIFPTIDDAKFWLLHVVKNLSINHVKKKQRETVSLEKIKKAPVVNFYKTGEQELLLRESQLVVRRAIAQLQDIYRNALVLREYADLDYKEIAKLQNTTETNVKVRVHRARKELENILASQGQGSV